MPQTDRVEFTDKYGDARVIRRGPEVRHGGWALKKTRLTPAQTINSAVSALIGARVKELRLQRGYTLEELCTRAGIVSATPKERMWEIENMAARNGSLRLGTIYALAIALDVDVWALLPAVEEVRHVVQPNETPTLVVAK